MPRSTRDAARRQLERAQGNILWARRHLMWVHTIYNREGYTEIATPLDDLDTTLAMLSETIGEVRNHL